MVSTARKEGRNRRMDETKGGKDDGKEERKGRKDDGKEGRIDTSQATVSTTLFRGLLTSSCAQACACV